MPSSRRAFAAAVVAALSGCTGRGDDRRDHSGNESSPTADGNLGAADAEGEVVPGPTSRSFEDPFGTWIPDLTVVNHHTDGMTAYVRVVARPWGVSTFEETLSVRGRTPGHQPVSATVTTVRARTPRSDLAILTADGRRGRQPYRGGGPERGVLVHVHEDGVAFERERL